MHSSNKIDHTIFVLIFFYGGGIKKEGWTKVKAELVYKEIYIKNKYFFVKKNVLNCDKVNIAYNLKISVLKRPFKACEE